MSAPSTRHIEPLLPTAEPPATPAPFPRDKNPLPLVQTIQHKSPI